MTTETETNSAETATENSEATTTGTTTAAETTETSTGSDSLDLSKTGAEDETETSTTDTTTTEAKTGDDEEVDARYGAPAEDAQYEISGLPEGMTVDTEALEAVAPIFRDLNLSNEAASKVAGVYAEKVLPMVEAKVVEGIEQRVVAQRTEWEGAARDLIAGKNEAGEALVAKNKLGEELGFDGLDIKGVQKTAARALDRIAPAGFREFLDETGLGVHPQMIAFAYQAGKMLGEDTAFETTGSAPKKAGRVEKYYG